MSNTTDAEKLEQIRTRVSDLGTMLATVKVAELTCPLLGTLYNRLLAIRKIVLEENPVEDERIRNAKKPVRGPAKLCDLRLRHTN